MDIFWTVLVEGTTGGYCKRHSTIAEAKQEAARLVALGGKRAFVLELVASLAPSLPIWEMIGQQPDSWGKRT